MTDRPLENHRWEAFCLYFVFGNPEHDSDPARRHDPANPPDTRHNGTQSYVAAGYKARGHAAGANAHRLLRNADIQGRIGTLRKEAQLVASVYMRHWKTLLPRAQAVLIEAMDEGGTSSQAVRAACEVIKQAEGPAHLRFGAKTGPQEREGLNITLWSGTNRD